MVYVNRFIIVSLLLLLAACGNIENKPDSVAIQAKYGNFKPEPSGKDWNKEENNAYDVFHENKIRPELTKHSQWMKKKIYSYKDKFYSAVGYGLCVTNMVVGDDGIIIVDPNESIENSTNVLSEFRKITSKPVKAIVFTHSHHDHFAGVKVYTTNEDVRSGKVKIIAHKDFLYGVKHLMGGKLGKVLDDRLKYTLGAYLEHGPDGTVNGGLGPLVVGKTATMTLIEPNIWVDDILNITIAGVKMQMLHVPSETPDEIVVWFPDDMVLNIAEVMQGESFPNLHTIRGTRYRDQEQWYKSIDRIRRAYQPEVMVGSHIRPVIGKKEVSETLTNYRDGIQYVYDQTVRYINKGKIPEELIYLVKLPNHLVKHHYLQDYYGAVSHSVRQVFFGELGWFKGDPTELQPTPMETSAKRMIDIMGGRDSLINNAMECMEKEDYQFAAELLTYIIRVDKEDMDARYLKAECLRQLGYQQININWRNWYLTSARELDGTLKADMQLQLNAPDVLAAYKTSDLVEMMTSSLKAEETLDKNIVLGMKITDTGEAFGLEIRRGVCEFIDRLPEKTDVLLETTKPSFLMVFLLKKKKFVNALKDGSMKVSNPQKLGEFFSYFEKHDKKTLNLTLK